jgi:2-polyprenyl-3-methyl-5-hydroxy-6-metoxy-1,4-benzoquinol methylase
VREIGEHLRDCRTVLDIGCGTASPLKDVPGDFYAVGLDAHRPALEASRRAGLHDAYILQDVRAIDLLADSYDAVVLLDLIEHLPEGEARALLSRAEHVAARKLILSTPNGFLYQGAYDDNPFQAHRSGWAVDALQALGYRVIGIQGHKALRGERARLRAPRPLTAVVSALSEPVVHRRPRLAFELLAIKDVARSSPALTEPRCA